MQGRKKSRDTDTIIVLGLERNELQTWVDRPQQMAKPKERLMLTFDMVELGGI